MDLVNAKITGIDKELDVMYVSVIYMQELEDEMFEKDIKLVVDEKTNVMDSMGKGISRKELQNGMIIDANISETMTRSIPPQAVAFLIRIVGNNIQNEDNYDLAERKSGRICEIDRVRRVLDVITEQEGSMLIRFNVPDNTEVYDRSGRELDFFKLTTGMEIEIIHANFMTASLPPQTTAYKINVI